MRRYAYTLVVWLDFLMAIGRSWNEATARDVEAFKDWRLTDMRNYERIQATSFDTDRAGLNTFYTWASGWYGIANPVKTVPAAGTDSADASLHSSGATEGHRYSNRRRDPLRPAGSKRRQVKWLLRPALEQWRDIGLRGYGFDGCRKTGWRGFHEDRDVAFVDGLYGTGLRIREWASILDIELPTGGRAGLHRAWLAAECIKGGGEGRNYWIPRRSLQSVLGYMDPTEGSRTEVIRRAQRRGTYEKLRGIRIVSGRGGLGRTIYVEGPAGPVPMSLDVLCPDERQLLFRRTPHGLEPLWVWLSITGLPKKPYSWEDTFDAANERVKEAWVRSTDPDRQMSEENRERARSQCPLWATPHMLRHSFALRWFSILSLVEERRLTGFTDEEAADLRDRIGDFWMQLAMLMGHSHPDTTRDHYLEPFTGLQVSYLMELLDDEEQAGVDALVRAFASVGGSTLGPASVSTARPEASS